MPTPSQPAARAPRSFPRTSSRAVTAYLSALTGEAGWRHSGRAERAAGAPAPVWRELRSAPSPDCGARR